MDASAQCRSEDLLGGRYRLLERIGAGAMATVYRANDEFLGREVALKLISKRTSADDELRHDDDEVKVLARLNHHSLVTLLDAGVDARNEQPMIYLVMELIKGPDLRQRLAEESIPTRQLAQIGYDLAEGLDYMHHRGVVHRDVKPANIMIVDYHTDESRVRAKLTDFGIALMVGSKQPGGEGVSGTISYLSPEQVKDEPVGPASDIYSFGLVLLRCLTGETPFPGTPIESSIARVMRDPEIPAELDREWQELLTAMTAAEPSARPTAREVAMALYDLAVASRGRRKVDASILPADEDRRMDAVQRYSILDTPPDGAFDRITALAARLFSVPMAIVSVVDHDRIWFKSHHGLDVEQIDRDPGLCASAILQDDPWVITDAPADPRALANPLVAGEFGLKFYAGVPLRTGDGHRLGTLCVLDRKPRSFSLEDSQNLQDLAAVVMNDLELRLESRQLDSRRVLSAGETTTADGGGTVELQTAS